MNNMILKINIGTYDSPIWVEVDSANAETLGGLTKDEVMSPAVEARPIAENAIIVSEEAIRKSEEIANTANASKEDAASAKSAAEASRSAAEKFATDIANAKAMAENARTSAENAVSISNESKKVAEAIEAKTLEAVSISESANTTSEEAKQIVSENNAVIDSVTSTVNDTVTLVNASEKIIVKAESDTAMVKSSFATTSSKVNGFDERITALENKVPVIEAKDIKFSGAGLKATNVKAALDEIYTTQQSNKTAIANAITIKGTSASKYMGLEQLAKQILLLSGSGNGDENGLVVTSTIAATANMAYQIPTVKYLIPSKAIAQVYRMIPSSTNVINYQNSFDNSESKSFDYDDQKVQFDGVMKIKDMYEFPFTPVDDYFETPQIDFSEFVEFGDSSELGTDKLVINGVKTTEEIVVASGDIELEEVTNINSVSLASTGNVFIAFSKDEGKTWQVKNSEGAFVDIDIYNSEVFKTQGLTAAQLSAITKDEWASYRGESNKIRFSYFIYVEDLSVVSSTDLISMNVDYMARWALAGTNEYTLDFDPVAQVYNIKFVKAQDYKVKYREA